MSHRKLDVSLNRKRAPQEMIRDVFVFVAECDAAETKIKCFSSRCLLAGDNPQL